MSTGTLLLTMAACGLVTFLIRLSFIAFGHHLPDDPRITAVLGYVPPAILGALIAPEIAAVGGSISLSSENPRLWAALVALLVARLTRSVLATIAAGMLALWAIQAGLG
ncbi:MAG: AzlD domain-containing protein [Dechloromonas sp.]|jgi:branched-subunit amino acid transport protein|uniref:AzlD domain-containing protein n=1 Tax=Candidatus Dechloromonas phosphorivorans TaxID=2899244 RepID=A0A9D7LPY4_9RHOO|nr:AzlD domain-containing protein [Candidatus Dechloromonas phosphorivorans]